MPCMALLGQSTRAGTRRESDKQSALQKVKRCPRARPHDWTQCPFAHPGEKAKRRDPRRYRYSGTACPEFRRVRDDAVFACLLALLSSRGSTYADVYCLLPPNLSARTAAAAAATPAPLRTASSSAGCTPRATARRCVFLFVCVRVYAL